MGLYGTIIVVPADETTGQPSTASSLSRSMISCSKAERSRPLTRRARRIPRWAGLATPCSSTANPEFFALDQRDEVVRLYLTNTANTRVFNVALRGARMKLVGGDSGRYERETLVERRHRPRSG